MLDSAFPVTLTDLLTAKVLEPRAEGSVDIVVLSENPVLTRIVQRIELIAPVADKVEPIARCLWSVVGASNVIVDVIIGVCVEVLTRVPEGTTVSPILEDTIR